ncbi:hypothetical protein O3M35_012864 [Rhynocoris fuscipes]|uniref:G-protein coupled receptors family 1 profile domain-containing protein n=1 Tax=Rhynocoris fuscipes TaxID=488301 RepID=A0AAW1CEC7_9HEMI
MVCSRGFLVSLPLATAFAILTSIILFLRYGSCPEGSFGCDGSYSLCVAQSLVCDSKPDCPNSKDESLFVCRDLHGAFWDLIELWADSHDANHTCALDIYPDGCNCSDHTVLICNHMNLTYIPANISKNTSKLVLIGNRITLSGSSFNQYSLTMINLADNALTSLPEKVFQKQKKSLEKLILLDNKLRILPENIFNGLHKVEWIFLQNNQLIELNLNYWNMEELNWLDVSHNKLTLSDEFFPDTLPSLSLLYLEWNDIERVTQYTFSNLKSLKDLNLGWNNIKYIERNAFTNLVNLLELNLSNNQLRVLDADTFQRNLPLRKLDLTGNIRLELATGLFTSLTNLSSLGLEDIDIYGIDQNMFTSLKKLHFIYFKRFKYCMYVPHVPSCSPHDDGVSSDEDLLGDMLMRTTLWLVAIFILLSNGLVLTYRLRRTNRHSSPLNLIITNLAVSDFLMGLYLLVVGIVDGIYRGRYKQVASEWVSSSFCTIAGITALLSSEVGLLLLWLISLERFLLISAFFRGYNSLKPKVALATTLAIWLFVLVLALLPVFVWRHAQRFYGTNSFCFPLHIDEPFAIGWHYSAVIYLGINVLALLCIALFYLGMFVSIWKTRHATTINFRDSEFALRFFCIVLANSCCWVPVIVLKILAMSGFTFPKDVYGWLAIFVIPVNSAVNPVLHTFTTPGYMVGAQITVRAQIPNDLPTLGIKTLRRRWSGTFNKQYTDYTPKIAEEETQLSSRHCTST